MVSTQLIVFSLVLICSGMSSARSRGGRVRPYWDAKVRNPDVVGAKPAGEPEREPSSLSARQAGSFHSKLSQDAGQQLRWRFPKDPVDPVKRPPVQLEVQQPAVSNRVGVRCGESKIQVEVSQDMLGLGTLVNPDEITLGGCPVSAVDHDDRVLIFESELHDCGGTLEVRRLLQVTYRRSSCSV